MYPIIGLCGNSGVGKDTICGYIREAHPSFKRVAFADALKDSVGDYCELTEPQKHGDRKEKRLSTAQINAALTNELIYQTDRLTRGAVRELMEAGEQVTPRKLFQMVGLAARKEISDTYWIDTGLEKAHEMLVTGEADLVIITDVRFKNEVLAIRKLGGKVYKIEADVFEGVVGVAGHPSETELNSIPSFWFDEVYTNTKTDTQTKAQIIARNIADRLTLGTIRA